MHDYIERERERTQMDLAQTDNFALQSFGTGVAGWEPVKPWSS